MKVHKKFITKLAENKFSQVGEIILELGVVTKTDRSLRDAFHKFKELEIIFYTVDFLKENNFIEFGQKYYDRTTFPITSKIVDPEGEELVTHGKIKFLDKYITEYWGMEVFIRPSIYKYIDNGFKTDEEKDKDIQFWKGVIIAVVTAFLTAVFTSWFSDSSCLIKL